MTLAFTLTWFRKYKDLPREIVAENLSLSLEKYTDLEKGQVKIDHQLAQKLSDLYQAPTELFLIDDVPQYLQAEVMYNHCTITSGEGGASGYINHQNNDRGIEEILYLREEEVKRLERHVEYLRKQNDKLLGLLQHRSSAG